jgi:TolA-binding protein
MKSKTYIILIFVLTAIFIVGNTLTTQDPPMYAGSLKISSKVKKKIYPKINFEKLINEIDESNKIIITQLVQKKLSQIKKLNALEKKVNKLNSKVNQLSEINDSLVKVLKDSTIKKPELDSLKNKKIFTEKIVEKIIHKIN